MKKFLIILIAALCFSVAANAQPKAIGLRLGYGAEVSYQHYARGRNFTKLDLGIFSTAFSVSGLYNFHLVGANNFHVYVGPGIQAGWSFPANTLILGVAGMVGVEYNIPGFPMNISLDWRPVFNLMNSGFIASGFGLGLRYRF